MGDFVTIVSGLPRSGTSMMMRMLEAGGLPVVVDNLREADEDNPGGYYELEAVKEIKRDQSWLEASRGKAVKMVSMLLFDLPPGREYRVLLMRRDLDEILASQRVMLQRRGEGADFEPAEMRRRFAGHVEELLAWLRRRAGVGLLEVGYRDVLERPLEEAGRINAFLGGGLDVQAMARTVDRSLYRQRGQADAAAPPPARAQEPGAIDEEDREKIEEQLRSLGYL